MVAPEIANVENVLESWIGGMAKFILKKQLKDARVDNEHPSKESLERLVMLLETKCLGKMLDPNKIQEVKKDLKRAIETQGPLEDEKTLMLNRRIRTYLRKKFGDVAVHTLNIQKRELGMNNGRNPEDYKILAEKIGEILGEMVDKEMADDIKDGMCNIINEDME